MRLSGIITAMVTPFDEFEHINYNATAQLIEFLIGKGVSGIFILGTNGEFQVLTTEEKIKFAQFVVEKVKKRVPIIVGVGGNSTREVITLAEQMNAIGVDYLSVITPYFNSLTEDELYQHYCNIAEHSPVPILLYNIPKITGNPLTIELVTKLAEENNIIGIKDSSGNIENIKGYIKNTKDKNFDVLIGSDSLILEALKLGARGAVAATSNAIIENDLRIYSEFISGNLEAAQEAQNSIEEFRRILKYATIPAVLKQTIMLRGINVGQARRPVLPVKEKYLDDIEKVMLKYIEEAEGYYAKN
ncbi:4-hydroxy-tetrahydrodipicolinate synthase [Streptococcus ovis]|uniref:4-hydroxy-tetrahydrodipicolinate synthase n=1 Tax=Streptococcus ovis TaxID=82806 RepID=UPI00036B6592|nr:4-hydroxy-tetrahydrodipicolinate synthase [Streptococcus ovis]